jgi:hypothetical protein
MTTYEIHARDPDGSFHQAVWSTPQLPSIGEDVYLPDGEDSWQEMQVSEVCHYPDRVEVWLGWDMERSGWDDGSVTAIFELARQYRPRDEGPYVFDAACDLAKALRQLVNAALPDTLSTEHPFWVAARNARATLSQHEGLTGEQDP